jgi:hypothetical protein
MKPLMETVAWNEVDNSAPRQKQSNTANKTKNKKRNRTEQEGMMRITNHHYKQQTSWKSHLLDNNVPHKVRQIRLDKQSIGVSSLPPLQNPQTAITVSLAQIRLDTAGND